MRESAPGKYISFLVEIRESILNESLATLLPSQRYRTPTLKRHGNFSFRRRSANERKKILAIAIAHRGIPLM